MRTWVAAFQHAHALHVGRRGDVCCGERDQLPRGCLRGWLRWRSFWSGRGELVRAEKRRNAGVYLRVFFLLRRVKAKLEEANHARRGFNHLVPSGPGRWIDAEDLIFQFIHELC